MSTPARPFRESNLFGTPIRDLGLSIDDTRLAPVIAQFRDELNALGLTRLVPGFYLSMEWGVPFGSVSIALPFYLARPDLTDLHGEQVGHIEGFNPKDILRYLRHEMGHVINYAYKLYEDEDWVKLFGSITQPYIEDYRPQPFSRRFVRHLPGWYAQKHPDEDWAETFAVWMTPGRNWRADYAQWPSAMAKLEYCERTMQRLRERDPLVVRTELDEPVSDLTVTLQDYYKNLPAETEPSPGLDGDLRAIFSDPSEIEEPATAGEICQASDLIRRLERPLMADVFRWTGHFPEKVRSLMRHLAKRAELLKQVYLRRNETEAMTGVTILVTSLAMNHVHRGSYFPEAQPVIAPPTAQTPSSEQPAAESEETNSQTANEPEPNQPEGNHSDAQSPPATTEASPMPDTPTSTEIPVAH